MVSDSPIDPAAERSVVLRAFPTQAAAEAALRRLVGGGVPGRAISILGQSFDGSRSLSEFLYDAREDGAFPAAEDFGLLGQTQGLGVFALVDLCPVIVFGPVADVLVGVLAGPGGDPLVTTLEILGVELNEALIVQEWLRAGDYVVLVGADAGFEVEALVGGNARAVVP